MEKFETSSGPHLEATDAETFKALETKLREMASEGEDGPNVTERDIHQAALHAALVAEKGGTPFTAARINEFGTDVQGALVESLNLRVKERPGASGARIIDSTGAYIGTAESPSDAQRIVTEDRESGDRAT